MFVVSDSARDSLKSVLDSEKGKDRKLVLYLQGVG